MERVGRMFLYLIVLLKNQNKRDMRTILMYIYFLTCVVCQLMAGNDVPESNISFKGIVEIKGTPISFNYRYQPVTQEVGIVFHNGFLIYKNSNEPLRALDVREKKYS